MTLKSDSFSYKFLIWIVVMYYIFSSKCIFSFSKVNFIIFRIVSFLTISFPVAKWILYIIYVCLLSGKTKCSIGWLMSLVWEENWKEWLVYFKEMELELFALPPETILSHQYPPNIGRRTFLKREDGSIIK